MISTHTVEEARGIQAAALTAEESGRNGLKSRANGAQKLLGRIDLEG